MASTNTSKNLMKVLVFLVSLNLWSTMSFAEVKDKGLCAGALSNSFEKLSAVNEEKIKDFLVRHETPFVSLPVSHLFPESVQKELMEMLETMTLKYTKRPEELRAVGWDSSKIIFIYQLGRYMNPEELSPESRRQLVQYIDEVTNLVNRNLSSEEGPVVPSRVIIDFRLMENRERGPGGKDHFDGFYFTWAQTLAGNTTRARVVDQWISANPGDALLFSGKSREKVVPQAPALFHGGPEESSPRIFFSIFFAQKSLYEQSQ